MYEAGKPFLQADFFEDQAQAAEQFAVYQRGGQNMQIKVKVITDFLENIHFPIFVVGISVNGLCILMYATAFGVIACVLWKGERKYKNIAHLSWITSVFTLLVSIMYMFFAAISLIVINDTCSMYREVD